MAWAPTAAAPSRAESDVRRKPRKKHSCKHSSPHAHNQRDNHSPRRIALLAGDDPTVRALELAVGKQAGDDLSHDDGHHEGAQAGQEGTAFEAEAEIDG